MKYYLNVIWAKYEQMYKHTFMQMKMFTFCINIYFLKINNVIS